MKKTTDRKLTIAKDTIRKLPEDTLDQAAGGAYTDRPGCRLTVPMSFCVCASKHNCSINC